MQTGIIVADDDVMVRSVLRSVLMSFGHDVFMATTGEEAMGLASRMRAMLILLDLNMPKLNGLLACERLRALPNYADTPIAMLSAYNNENARKASARVGSTLFISKPFQPATLLATLGPFLATRPVSPGRLHAEADPARYTLDRGRSVLGVCRGGALPDQADIADRRTDNARLDH